MIHQNDVNSFLWCESLHAGVIFNPVFSQVGPIRSYTCYNCYCASSCMGNVYDCASVIIPDDVVSWISFCKLYVHTFTLLCSEYHLSVIFVNFVNFTCFKKYFDESYVRAQFIMWHALRSCSKLWSLWAIFLHNNWCFWFIHKHESVSSFKNTKFTTLNL